MTFFLIGGIVFVVLSVILIILFLVTHNIDEHSLASKILMWIGMLSSVAGAAFLTLEYSFPGISHPKKPSVYDHFVEYYGDRYYTFIKTYTEHDVVDGFVSVEHKQLQTITEDTMALTLFRTEVIYDVDAELYMITFINKYEYNQDYSYQNVVSYEIR